MKFYISHHQHKGKPYMDALLKGKWVRAEKDTEEDIDLALFDQITSQHYPGKFGAVVQSCKNSGSAIVCYPHSPIVPCWFDGWTPMPEGLDCLLVIAKGQKEIAKKHFLQNTRIEATGFPYCVQKKFTKPDRIKKILFAPVHPDGGGLLSEEVQANRNIFRELKRLQRGCHVEVTIRYLGKMEEQGIKPYPHFTFVKAKPDGKTDEIDTADVVIAKNTFMYLSVARGKPTIGINQHIPLRTTKSPPGWKPIHWDEYGAETAYPINYEKGNLWDLIQEAAQKEQTEWRKKFIGSSLKSEEFCKLMEDVVLDARR